MQRQEVLIPTTSGFKRFFSPRTTGGHELHVRGIGIRELMPPCMIERPRGRRDYLFMLFHDPAVIDTKPSKKEPYGPDTMMIWPPGKGQYYGNRARRFSHTWIHCEGDRIRRALRGSSLPMLSPFLMPNSSMFQQCLLNIHGELVSYAAPDPVIIGNLLENCLREIARSMKGAAAAARIPENLLAVHRLVSSAPAHDISLGEMARMAGMSTSYFCSRFKSIFGLAPGECLIQHRMHHAVHLLNNRNLSISQIAAQVGYDDLFHFSKMFKKQFGLSPRAMRQRDGAH